MIQLSQKEARIALMLAGDTSTGESAIRPGRDSGQDALALLERLRAYVKCDGSSADADTYRSA